MTTNDALTAALEVVVANRAIDDAFVSELGTAEVWLPVAVTDDGRMSLIMLNADDAQYVAAFTSRELLESGNPQAASVAQSYEWVASNLPPGAGIVLNPGQTVSLTLSNSDALALVSRQPTIRAGEVVRMGDPAEEPVELLDRVAVALESQNAVIEARRVWAQVGNRAPGLVLGLGFIEGADATDQKLAFSAVSDAAGEVEFSVDLVPLVATDGFAEWMLANTEPFFSRPV